MIKYIITGLIAISVISGFFCETINDVSNASIMSCEKAVELSIKLAGSMALWGGVMRVAEKSGLVKKVSLFFKRPVKWLFKGINPDGKAFGAIIMNITANILGLGNAATPLGIQAMTSLAKEENAGSTATRNMIVLVVLNTASIQILPTTIASLRLSYGASNPLDVLPAILITSAFALIVGLFVATELDKIKKGKLFYENN